MATCIQLLFVAEVARKPAGNIVHVADCAICIQQGIVAKFAIIATGNVVHVADCTTYADTTTCCSVC